MHSFTEFDTRDLTSHLPHIQVDKYYRTFQNGNNKYGILSHFAFPLIKNAPNGKDLLTYRLSNKNVKKIWYNSDDKKGYPQFICEFGSYKMHRIVAILSGAPKNSTYTETDFLDRLTVEHLNGNNDDWNYYNLALCWLNDNIDFYNNKLRIEMESNINRNNQD